MSIAQRALAIVTGFWGSAPKRDTIPDAEEATSSVGAAFDELECNVHSALKELDTTREMLKAEERKSASYFRVIEEVIKERQTWREFHREHEQGHMNAQRLLEQMIMSRDLLIKRLCTELNEHRQKASIALIDDAELSALVRDVPFPDGKFPSEEFHKMLRGLDARAPKDIDGLALRERIAAGHEAQL